MERRMEPMELMEEEEAGKGRGEDVREERHEQGLGARV
jgi:hypothetical protein